MEDKILDDDDIIDLTDLLEEGEPTKKGKGKKEEGSSTRSPSPEPDSFDLGKEISMEYDVSVEEIDHAGEALDIDASLSANEKVALIEEKPGEEEKALTEALDAAAAAQPEAPAQEASEDLSLDVGDEISAAEAGGEKPGAASPEIPAPAAAEAVVPPAAKAGPGTFDMEKVIAEEAEPDAGEGRAEMAAVPAGRPAEAADMPALGSDALAEIRQEIPAMIEGIVKPLVSELVREMVTATREQLPGIVEKVIREEIDRLKKLES